MKVDQSWFDVDGETFTLSDLSDMKFSDINFYCKKEPTEDTEVDLTENLQTNAFHVLMKPVKVYPQKKKNRYHFEYV